MSSDISCGKDITPADVPVEYANLTAEKALELDLKSGDLISIRNLNNLSEVLIYQRTDYNYKDNRILRWDGKTIDVSWYNDTDTVLTIYNAEQLAGLASLVNDGNSFEGRIIRLGANINLNGHEWVPIGRGISMQFHTATGHPKATATSIKRPFSGTFDGNHFSIYGLTITDILPDIHYIGFFGACVNATIQNITFSNVKIGNLNSIGSYSALAGLAINTTFTNIIVSGYICGPRIGGICGIAVDTSFHSCVNRAMMSCGCTIPNHTLSIGGIVQQISLSEESLEKIPENSYAMLFNHCIRNGTTTADAQNAKYLWSGQIYGSIESDARPTRITLNRCLIKPFIVYRNLNTMKTKANVVGLADDGVDGRIKSISPSYSHKHDLLGGLLGKTDISVGVQCYNPTASMMINSLPIPGSVNVLKSRPMDKFFTTTDVLPLDQMDGVVNLLPYYKYIKTATI